MKYLITKLWEPDWTGRCNPNSGHVCFSDYKFQGASEQIMTINENIMSCFSSIIIYVIMKITKINKLKHKSSSKNQIEANGRNNFIFNAATPFIPRFNPPSPKPQSQWSSREIQAELNLEYDIFKLWIE